MKRHYFYAPSKYRENGKEKGIISFELKAFYSEKAFSDKAGREITRFNYIDQVGCKVNTRWAGNYRFEFDHGKDGCEGHWAKSIHELKTALKEENFNTVTEGEYFRLRKLALKLMYRHTNFTPYWTGLNKYFYRNNTGGGFYDLKLASFHYHHLLRTDTLSMRKWRFSANIPSYNIKVSEQVRIFIAKNKDGDRYDSYKFSLESNKVNRSGNFTSLDEAVDFVYGRNEQHEITRHQYERLRKISKLLIWENDELDISALKKKQNYRVRILDL